jgi:hypothetical protein
MKAMYAAFIAIAVISVVADVGLGRAGFSAAETTTGPDVRLD